MVFQTHSSFSIRERV
ncbi:hypothetical protein [Fusicatenibacter saccharivorans]